MVGAYEIALITAFKETGLSEGSFPEQCLWSFDEVMNENFWSDAPNTLLLVDAAVL